MTEVNKNTPAATTEVVIPAVVHTVERNSITATLKRTETERVKEGATAVMYWTIDLAQFEQPEIKDATGKVTQAANEYAVWEATDTLLSHDMMLSKLQAKLNQDMRSAQLEAGKDIYTPDEKLDRVKAYVAGGFGAERSFATNAAFNALKKLDTEKSAILSRLMEIGKLMMKFAELPPEQAAALITEMNTLNAKAATLK